MNWKNSPLLIMSETAALGWFILRGISFVALIPLIPLGFIYYRGIRGQKRSSFFLNGLTLIAATVVCCMVLSHGMFQGKGFLLLIALLWAIGIFGMNVPEHELARVAGWWNKAFLILFLFMLIATLFGARSVNRVLLLGEWWELLVFYLLAFLEPFSMGNEYAAAPMSLAFLLLPFGAAAYFALGEGAFAMAQFPYLSVWSGVSIFSIHHIEGILLGFYYGLTAFRCVKFCSLMHKRYCKPLEDVVE